MKNTQMYVDFRMKEWEMAEQSPRIQRVVRRVLNELHPEALLTLKDKVFEVIVTPAGVSFDGQRYELPALELSNTPLLRSHLAQQGVLPKPETQIVLILDTVALTKELVSVSTYCLKANLGRIFIKLRTPESCSDTSLSYAAGMKEWRSWTLKGRAREFARQTRRAA